MANIDFINADSEEALKVAVYNAYFSNKKFILSTLAKVDFAIAIKSTEKAKKQRDAIDDETQWIYWAEAKKGKADFYESVAQLILTIGKEKTFQKYIPPKFIGAFDAENIVFLPYDAIMEIFGLNDFDWQHVRPSDHTTKESKLVVKFLKNEKLKYKYRIWNFIENNLFIKDFINQLYEGESEDHEYISVDINNFKFVYDRWLDKVKPTIQVSNWEKANKKGIVDADFYLADLLSENDKSIKKNLFVILNRNHYELDKTIDDEGFFSSKTAVFDDNQEAHKAFWSKYKRPPEEKFWAEIIDRRDLLVPRDVRERKGSFFTPQQWVELSQKYLADTLGTDWQDKYYIWDCAAGTGNLLYGLTNKNNIWASTIDKADVDVMTDAAVTKRLPLHKNHIFKFDFLNDDFNKLPAELREIINNPEKRKNLVIYINPPYAEATSATTVTGTGTNKSGVAITSNTYKQYKEKIGKAGNEVYAQFLIRIYCEIPSCRLANFSKLKNLQAPNFADFRKIFKANLLKLFLVPADTFDNVKGQFPIGFFIWDTGGDVNYPTFNRRVNPSVNLKGFVSDDVKPQGIQVFHITWPTYNTRMVRASNFASSVILSDEERNKIAQIIDQEIGIEKFKITAINILNDHVHCIVICSESEIENIIRKIKGYSSFYFHATADTVSRRVNPLVDEAQYSDGTRKKLWARSFSKTYINSEDQLLKAIYYVNNNHLKHNLPELKYKFHNLISFEHIFTDLSTECVSDYSVTTFNRRVNPSVNDNDIVADVYDKNGNYIKEKKIICNDKDNKSINDWINKYQSSKDAVGYKSVRKITTINRRVNPSVDDYSIAIVKNSYGTLFYRGNDFQNQKYIYLAQGSSEAHDTKLFITAQNLILSCIYLSVRQCIPADWLNDRDQFLYPNDGWKKDKEFQSDCLAFTLFHTQNRITSTQGTNNWIPFTEDELDLSSGFKSHFMTDFIAGKLSPADADSGDLFASATTKRKALPMIFSSEAEDVFAAGLNLWNYYMIKSAERNVNASFYDIKAFFQGRSATGRMNNKSDDEKYNKLLNSLRKAMDTLAKKIEPKVYEFGFLK